MNLLLAICLGTCIAPHTATPEQREATEFLAILEYLGGIEDEAKWDELVHTLDSKVSASSTAVSTTPVVGAETPERGLELVEVIPAERKDPAL